VHTLPDVRSKIQNAINVTDRNVHDVNILDQVLPDAPGRSTCLARGRHARPRPLRVYGHPHGDRFAKVYPEVLPPS
jgi:hypothetical protein